MLVRPIPIDLSIVPSLRARLGRYRGDRELRRGIGVMRLGGLGIVDRRLSIGFHMRWALVVFDLDRRERRGLKTGERRAEQLKVKA